MVRPEYWLIQAHAGLATNTPVSPGQGTGKPWELGQQLALALQQQQGQPGQLLGLQLGGCKCCQAWSQLQP